MLTQSAQRADCLCRRRHPLGIDDARGRQRLLHRVGLGRIELRYGVDGRIGKRIPRRRGKRRN